MPARGSSSFSARTSILVNADDFGLHADIDRGILQCIERGAVQSVSFSPQGRSLDWRKLAELQRGGVRVGLHLTLVGEPWGTTGQVFAKWPQLLKWLMLSGPAGRRRLAAEADWQIGQCLERGIHPDHIDSHQHVHVFPGIWETAMRLRRAQRIARIRVPRCPTWRVMKKNLAGVVLQVLATRRARAVERPLPCLGLARAGHNTTDVLLDELKALQHARAAGGASASADTIELVMHPGVNTPDLERTYPDWRFNWTAERDALLDPRLHEALQILNCAFATRLPRAPAAIATPP